MKKLFCIIATKMQPSLVQNIIGRLGSKTPKLFRLIQLYSAIIIAVLVAAYEALSTHQVPDFPHEQLACNVLQFAIALFTGIGGAAALPTTDPKFVSPDVKDKVIEDATRN